MQCVTFTLRCHLSVLLDMSRNELNPYERAEEAAMRKWYLPMTVVGLGGLGVLLFTDRGRRALGWLAEHLPDASHQLADWNETAQRELDHIQASLDEVAATLRDEGLGSQSAFSH
jgi:hypothetical protein